ncbi:hypothetical protein NBRC10512_002370 [Rhodotorula toruloides]|uniref:RHTO0S08e04632g1_1 n=2 Tax=Rhodotorula toruloides TaxID=5286 RepID=A0A061B9V5_RHOTO|nr:uncharacterized protein RHTO_01055 [Rhodotorula toruloides NP11]EMS22301.1 hypothetical protein RHTO_01055 [Rhodotorula toruloides NP11]CDR43699.1 RHTO0S08e04632g1_1 [Rhodotorula toruloides]
MPLLTHNGRSVFVNATCYAEVVAAAGRVFFASSGIPPPRVRLRLGWPLGSCTQELATSVELEEGAWPEGLLPQNTQLWVIVGQAAPLQIEGPAGATLHAAQAAGAPNGHDAAGALPDPAAIDNGSAGAPAAAASPTPTLINLNETDDDLFNETSTAIKDAKGKVLFRVPHVEDGSITFGDIFKTAESFLNVPCSLLLLRMDGTIWEYEDSKAEEWFAETDAAFFTPNDSCVVSLQYCVDPNKYAQRYGNYRDFKTVILDAGATILDLRRKLTAQDSDVYNGVDLDDVMVLPATSASQSADSNDPIKDDTMLASCRKAGRPLINLRASTRNAEVLRKEEDTRAAKKRKIAATLAGLIVRDDAAREDDE